MIVESEVTNRRRTTRGKLLKLKLQVTAPEQYKGRVVFDQLCIQHENTKTQEIAQGQLSAICHATAQLQLKNSSQVHNIPMKIRVIVTQDPGYDAKNEVKSYKPLDGGSKPARRAAAATPAAAPAAPSANAPAWAQKKSA
jgi:hypothetical protein